MKTIIYKRSGAILLCMMLLAGALKAQKQMSVDLGADLVSSYVWRGVRQTGFSIQPSLGAAYKGVSLGAWGSTDMNNEGFKEIDFTLGYSVGGLSLAVTDYWWDGEGAFRYFNRAAAGFVPWKSTVYSTDGFHVVNLMLSASKPIKITDRFSLSVFAGVILNPTLEDAHFVFGFRL